MENTNNQKTLYFKLFGGSVAYRSSREDEWVRLNESVTGGVGKKLESFLEYLILNHGKDISSEELIGVFWPEDSSNDPGSALKYTLHKARTLLKQIYPQEENLLLTRRGHYLWNPEVKLELDVEDFEELYTQARCAETAEAAANLLDAVNMYAGDILSNNDAEWLLPLRIYYRTLYIDACKTVLALLSDKDRWMDIIRVSEHAYALDPLTEEFTVFLMTGLIAIGQPDRAIEQYEAYRSMLWNELNLVPSEAAEQIHAVALEATSSGEQDIIQLLTEAESEPSAFLCSFSVFRSIVLLETRHMARSGVDSAILVIKAVRPHQNNTSAATDVRRVERVLLKTLRAGDPVARLNAGSYIVLLSGATADNAQLVMERIERIFRSTYPRSRAYLDYRIYPLEPSRFNK